MKGTCVFASACKHSASLTYEDGPGDHRWKYWDLCAQRLLEWLPLRVPYVGEEG
jgi:S-formylglutathione hydrolase FrmB